MAENEEGSGNRNKLGEILGPCVFVTVGSTTFRELTHTVLSEKFVKVRMPSRNSFIIFHGIIHVLSSSQSF